MTPRRLLNAKRHAEFCLNTLGPDLHESGMTATADDLMKCARIILELVNDERASARGGYRGNISVADLGARS
jgi:hypothetical protein